MIQESRKLALLAAISLLVVGYSYLIRVSSTIVNSHGEDKVMNIPMPSQNIASSPESEFFDSKENEIELKAASDSLLSSAKTAQNAPKKASIKPLDEISAKAYLVGNVETKKKYFERNSLKQLPVASMSKLVTAVIASDILLPTSVIEITESEAMAPPDSSGVEAGEKYALEEILYPMLLNSSNIAAEAIASSTDRIKFLELMSSKSWEIGMPQAYFADPSGVDPHNMASANDIFMLARYLYESRPDILKITRASGIITATTSDHGAHNFESTHPFVNDIRFIGGKTGRTKEAGETMLTIMRINDQIIAFIVMGSGLGARAYDTNILIHELEKII